MKYHVSKNFGFFLLVLLISNLLFPALIKAQTCAPAPVGLVSWYQGENNAVDSRSRFNGSLQNGASFAAGAVGQGFIFDGVDDYVSVPFDPALDPTSAGSLQAWVRFGQLPSNAGRIMEIVGKGAVTTDFDLQADTDNRFRFYIAAGTTVPSTTVIQTGVWYHIVGTWDSTIGLRIYVNGVLENTNPTMLTRSPSGQPLHIGHQPYFTGRFFNGNIDEVSVYNRALSEVEIQSIFTSGERGMCTPTAVTAPSGLVAWWAGDGNVDDISYQTFGLALWESGRYGLGKVGQGLDFSGALNSGASTSHHSWFNVASPGFTTEFWMKSNGAQPENVSCLIEKTHGVLDASGWSFQTYSSTNRVHFAIGDGISYTETISNPGILDGNFHHVAGTWDGASMRLYVDGTLQSTVGFATPFTNNRGVFLGFMSNGGTPVRFFNGRLDEVSIYNRALSQTEIQSIFSAGMAGKLKLAMTPVGMSPFANSDKRALSPEAVVTTVGDASVSFPSVSVAGITQQIPIDPNLLPDYPMGYYRTGLLYDVSSSAVYSGSPTVCFNLQAFGSQFAELRILHLENGAWVNRTSMTSTFPNLCTTGVTSLSPFAITGLSPTAARVSVAGRVVGQDGRGISKVLVTMAGNDGNTVGTLTGSFGYYRFDNVEAGRVYVISVRSRRYRFVEPSQVLLVSDDLDEVNFVAIDSW